MEHIDLINKFYIGEFVEVSKELFPDSFVDLTVTSPPYDDLRLYGGYIFDYESVLRELYRITKPGGMVVWVVADSTKNYDESGNSFRQALKAKEIGFKLFDTMIYHKRSGPPSTGKYRQSFEYMFVFLKGKKPNTVNLLKDKVNSAAGLPRFGRDSRRQKDGDFKIRDTEVIVADYGTRDNIWSYVVGYMHSHKDIMAHQHPATFPEKLANDHILSWTNEGDIVLDPMCGSGTTCKMAWVNKRNFIGVDINEDYIKNIAIPRLMKYGWHA